MAEDNKIVETNTQHLEQGTYEIIRSRLNAQKSILIDKIGLLNDERKKIFGAIETQLIANARINTDNNCIARDIVAIGNLCIFGYNVHFGLRKEIFLKDVFSIYEFSENVFHQKEFNLIANEQFEIDFQNLYKYYRNTIFSKFSIIGNYLYMVFQISNQPSDIKTFKWLIEDESLTYVDNRSEHECKFPAQHEFRWQKATRDMFRYGKHAHVSILDKVFVETIGGDLTIKVEDNTETGLGIYNEKVEYPDQTLDDAEYHYADLGNLIVLKIKPYKEDFQYFIFNNKIQEVIRVDSLKDTGILLPDSQGILFANGYYLQTGEYKVFDKVIDGIKFQERIASPNGEDHYFIFYQESVGNYLILMYNVINHQISTPIICNGATLFENGELVYFKSEKNATKHHVVQIWQTPFTKKEIITSEFKDNFLYKIGNKDIVRAMAECQDLIVLLNKDDNYDGLYQDIAKEAKDIQDAYYWITDTKAQQLVAPLSEIEKTANNAIDEFEKVKRIKKATQNAISTVDKEAKALFEKIKFTSFEDINEFVASLSNLRKLRGETIALKELRYADVAVINSIEQELINQSESISQKCVAFLVEEKALKPYKDRVEVAGNSIHTIEKVIDGNKLQAELNQIGLDLELLIEIVSNLKIEDTSHATKIIDDISGIFAILNQVKANTANKIKDLGGKEAHAQFFAQLKLIDQAIISHVDMSITTDKCDEYLAKMMVQLEELEGKFANYEEFGEKISEKREEIYKIFEAKRNQLIESKNKRSLTLMASGERILKSIKTKMLTCNSVEEINSYFASDLMIEKLNSNISQLFEMQDTGKAEDLSGQLKAAKEDAIRQLKDKQELFDGETIKLGKYNFSVNKQQLDLTIVNKNDELYFHLLGTNFYEKISDANLEENIKFWNQDVVSENDKVYRAEYLAWLVFQKVITQKNNINDWKQLCLDEAKTRYNDGYVKGVHDVDAAIIAETLYNTYLQAGILSFTPSQRIIALLWWFSLDKATFDIFNNQIKVAGVIKKVFPESKEFEHLQQKITDEIDAFNQLNKIVSSSIFQQAALYLMQEFADNDHWSINEQSVQVYNAFRKYLTDKKQVTLFDNSMQNTNDICEKYLLANHWLKSFLQQSKDVTDIITEEVCFLFIKGLPDKNKIIRFNAQQEVKNLSGNHVLISQGIYKFNYYHFVEKLSYFSNHSVPAFNKFRALKMQLIESYKTKLRLQEFTPKVLSSFVRNQLIDKVYLPLFGDNFAKQLGAAGDAKRTDRHGMLLLISPPGYGKTTIMEYIANRLGLVFVKINGPALGNSIISLDPDDAGNAAAKQELAKLNLGLEMGDNVMLYLDDIQHCNPEFLQKFISLCDAQRKIEGVFNGIPKTYDLRGKKVCVVMAGNPFTESGEKFRIPDMLANRADIYNLGDIIGNTEDMFKMSMIENALTSNVVLQKLINKNYEDVFELIKMIESKTEKGINFKGAHSKDELQEYRSVMKKILRIRDVVLLVNAQYIHSAAIAEEFRTEPPFKLQGSYRDMNKMVAKVQSIMNDEELEELIFSHYQSESQTLTNGAEANMLKFKELINSLKDEEQSRWVSIKETFVQNNKLKHLGNNQTAAFVQQLMSLSKNLEGIKDVLGNKNNDN